MLHLTAIITAVTYGIDANGNSKVDATGVTSQHHACKTIQEREVVRHAYNKATNIGHLVDFVEWEDDE